MERAFWLAWSQIPGMGSVLLKRLYLHFGRLSAAWDANANELTEIDGIGHASAIALVAERATLNPLTLLQTHERQNPNFFTPADPHYPRLLFDLPDPPAVLYYRGQITVLKDLDRVAAIALVGTRNPSDYGRRWTRKLSATLAQNGFVILSGLADGIDTEAHRSCLEVGGATIAVLGTGIDVVYPYRNHLLYDQLLKTGLALSEYPAGTLPDRTHFPRRNRIVAGLSRAVLVIEAPKKSGALITAHLANEYGRDVYALPGSLDNPKSSGCLTLINKGAQLILGEAELLETLGAIPKLDSNTQLEMQLTLLDLSSELTQVLHSIQSITQSHSSASLDAILQHTKMETPLVTSALLQLELLGLIKHLPGMSYQTN
ncbi:DNA-processing protein DprA [Myxacorys almedinensis]|uniref:DNA-protecting protein DprA n=1 Tax=Myxacorys almedinensis A TaxID=2690445 RepID=A0A8J7Z2W8_9CYAN|nr:DNA-processing protein DprA [Myxacorys almedinensis]NDJ18714.1 DNA-protecting protein DprA [Myxacorys almedinensis A]